MENETSTVDPIIYPEERLPAGKNIIAALQHVIAMFGATVLGPILMGFNPNVAIFFSGIATLLFYTILRGRIPSYLGSSFSFIAAVIAATDYSGTGDNPNIAIALGGIIAAGLLYAAIGTIIWFAGHDWLERLMPAALTGSIVAIIGLNLASVAVHQISGSGFDLFIGLLTVLVVALCNVYLPHFWGRLPILIGGGICYIVYFVMTSLFNLGKPIDFSGVGNAPWFGLPMFTVPVFDISAISLIAPVAIVLVAENLGHIKAIGAMTNRDLTPYLGKAFMADGLATMVSGAFGGTGVTTYAENMGVMNMTRNYSSLTIALAGLFAVFFGLSPKIGAMIHTIPLPVLGGLSFVLFGLITATAGRIWTENRVDFTRPKNSLAVGVALVMGAGDLTLKFGTLAFGGIATATLCGLVLYHVLNRKSETIAV